MHASWAAVSALLLLLLLLGTLFSGADAYSVELAPNSQECFILTVSEGASCSGNFEVVEGGETAVVVRVTDPDGKLRYESDGEIEGTFSFLARSSGDHVMCLTNGGGHRRPTETQVVGFNFRAGYAVKQGDREQSFVNAITELTEGLKHMRDHQSYMNQREDMHRQTLESTNSSVFWWTIAETVVLVGFAIWQISYIRTFFEVKRRM